MDVALRRAEPDDASAVHMIVRETIGSVYPRYYPAAVVAWFLGHHDLEAIRNDVSAGKVMVAELGGNPVGTGTLDGNRITRVFVLPRFQGRGVGSLLLDRLEQDAAARGGTVAVEASLPAALLYERRGYRTVSHGSWEVEPGSANGAVLVWEAMEKSLRVR